MSSTDRLRLYEEILLAWSARINLIGPEARRNLREHIREAVAAAEILQPSGEVLDVGSGGGLPAIPMGIVSPEARFHLVEADQKKWSFLKHVVRECQLNALVHGDRLERLVPRLEPFRFSLVTSRAVGNPEAWIPLLLPLLEPSGRVALFRRDPIGRVEGLVPDEVYELPRGEANRLVVLRKPDRGKERDG